MENNKDILFFAHKLKERRKALGFTQKELGKKLGISDAAITQYEKGRREPKRAILFKLADALDVNIDYFFRPYNIPPKQRTKFLLEEKGLSKEDLAQKSKVDIEIVEGIVEGSLEEFEPQDILKIAKVLDVQPHYLTGQINNINLPFTDEEITFRHDSLNKYSQVNKYPNYFKEKDLNLAKEYIKELQTSGFIKNETYLPLVRMNDEAILDYANTLKITLDISAETVTKQIKSKYDIVINK